MVTPEAEKVVPMAVVGEFLARHAAAVDDEEDEKEGGVARPGECSDGCRWITRDWTCCFPRASWERL